jgi:hypothetical protein
MERRRNKKVALTLLILLIVGIASYYLTKTKTPPILTTTHTSTTIPENKPPAIESLEYKEKVKKGELQEIKLVVNDENPTKAILKLNNTVINVPFYKKIDNKTIFSVTFDPNKYFEKEGKVYGNVTIYDVEGKNSSKNLSFLVNLEEPKIDVEIRKAGFGRYELYANVSDENLEDVKLFLNGKELNLLNENGLYKALIETYEDSNFILIAKDRFGLESKFSGSIFVSKDNPNAYYALKRGLDPKYINLILSLDNDSVQDSNEKAFIDYLINIQKHLEDERLKNEILKFTSDGKITSNEIDFLRIISKNSDENVKSILNIYFNSPKTFSEILRNAYNDANVKIDRDVFVGEFSNIAQKLGIGDHVKVLNVKNNIFEIKEINLPTIQAIGNYTLAIIQLNLPIHEKENIWLLTNATMINPDIFDFKPVTVKDMFGNSHVISSKSVARDTWALVEHLKYDPEIIKYPEIYLALSIKVQQNMYDLVDNPVLHERGEYYKPTDKIIWEKVIIPQWKYYRDSFPQFGNVSKRMIVFPIYDSNLLKKWIPNEDDLKIALMTFWNVYIDRRGIADIDKFIEGMKKPPKQRKWDEIFVFRQGLDGMVYTIQQMPRVYNDVINAYNKDKSLKVHYYGWITDRGSHGLKNMNIQFLGSDPLDWIYPGPLTKIPASEIDDYVVSHYDSINSYFSKNFKYWDLIKFIYGYGGDIFGWDTMKIYNVFVPIAFDAFGIPHVPHSVYYEHYINAPARYVAIYEDAIFGLPEDLLKSLKEGKYGEVLILPGNGFAIIGSSVEGVKKDIEYGMKNPIYPNAKYIEIRLPLRDYLYWYITGKKIYLFKMGNKG